MGGYTVTIRSQIKVPTDHTKSDFTIMESEIDLLIRIEACMVDSYDAGQELLDLLYTIGGPDLASGQYSFT